MVTFRNDLIRSTYQPPVPSDRQPLQQSRFQPQQPSTLAQANAANVVSSAAGSGSLSLGNPSGAQDSAQLIGQLLNLLVQALPQLQPALSQAQTNPTDTSSANAQSSAYTEPQDSVSSSDGSGQSNPGSADDSTANSVSAQSLPSSGNAGLDAAINQLVTAINTLTSGLPGGAQSGGGQTSNVPGQPGGGDSSSASGAGLVPSGPSNIAGAGNDDAAQPIAARGRSGNTTVAAGSARLADNKQDVLEAARAAGASPAQTAIILSIGQLETNDLEASQRDTAKTGDSTNLSAFNINKDLAQKLGWDPATGPDLNDPKNLGYVVGLVTKGLNQFGTDGFLSYLRGGSSGFANPNDPKIQDYLQAIYNASAAQLANPSLQTSNARVASYVGAI